jgi:hypothetical protein
MLLPCALRCLNPRRLRLHIHARNLSSTACAHGSNNSSPWGASTKHLTVVDAHCGGEPARVVVSGVPPVPGASVREQREYFMSHLDHYRTLLLTEPRGYPCQNANVILPPSPAHPDAAFGFLVLEQNRIYPAMSGHNCICVATVLLETGMVPMQEPRTRFTLEAPVRTSALVGPVGLSQFGHLGTGMCRRSGGICEMHATATTPCPLLPPPRPPPPTHPPTLT